jgi:hypothetical protein
MQQKRRSLRDDAELTRHCIQRPGRLLQAGANQRVFEAKWSSALCVWVQNRMEPGSPPAEPQCESVGLPLDEGVPAHLPQLEWGSTGLEEAAHPPETVRDRAFRFLFSSPRLSPYQA